MKPVQSITANLQPADDPGLPYAPPESPVIDDQTRRVVDALFEELMVIFPAWRQAWPDNKTLARAKRTWVKGFVAAGVNTREQLRFGLRRCREAGRKDFIPSIGRFLEWCEPSPEEMGQPALVDAYRQAVRKAHPSARFSWTHQAVYHAAFETGLDRLYQKPSDQTFEAFSREYRKACLRLLRGQPLRPLPERSEGDGFSIKRLPAPTPDPEIAREQLAAIRSKLGRGTA